MDAIYAWVESVLGLKYTLLEATQERRKVAQSEVVGLIIGGLRKPVGRYITDRSEVHLRQAVLKFRSSSASCAS